MRGAVTAVSAPAPAVCETDIAAAIRQSYIAAVVAANALRVKMLAVGYVLVHAERALLALGKLKKGRNDKGESLQSWLAENCPEVPYKTAMDWKGLAEKTLEQIDGPRDAALNLMLASATASDGSPSADIPLATQTYTSRQIRMRDAILQCKTKSELKQLLFPFLHGKAGRPAGHVADGRRVDANDPEAGARANWSRVIEPALNTTVLEPAARLLSLADVDDALTALRTLIDYLNARRDELTR